MTEETLKNKDIQIIKRLAGRIDESEFRKLSKPVVETEQVVVRECDFTNFLLKFEDEYISRRKERVKENLKAGMDIRDAVNGAMDSCCSKGILTDILSRCRTEVLAMLLTEYDEKKVNAYFRKEAAEMMQERVNELNRRLIADGRQKDLERSLTDKEYQEKLFQEYGIHIEDIYMI